MQGGDGVGCGRSEKSLAVEGTTSHAAPIEAKSKLTRALYLACMYVRGTAITAAPSLPPAAFGLGACESVLCIMHMPALASVSDDEL